MNMNKYLEEADLSQAERQQLQDLYLKLLSADTSGEVKTISEEIQSIISQVEKRRERIKNELLERIHKLEEEVRNN